MSTKIMGAVLCLLLLLSFFLDFRNTVRGGSVDLRNRLTGARLMLQQRDAYHYKWHEGDPQGWEDPSDSRLSPVNRTTVTPALLTLQLLFAGTPYRVTQVLWLVVQWLCLLGTALLGWRRCSNSCQRWIWAAIVVGFTYTAAWRLHAERGQAYILLGFIFSVWLTLTESPGKWSQWGAGIAVGLLIALRSPFALLVPFLLVRRRRQLPGICVGLLLGIGLPLLIEPASWSNYASAMRTHSNLYHNNGYPKVSTATPTGTIEGIPAAQLVHVAPIPLADFSIDHFVRDAGIHWLPANVLPLLVALPFLLWLAWARNRPLSSLLLGLTAWFFIADLFLPAFRTSYNDVLVLNVASLLMSTMIRFPVAGWFCLAALATGWSVLLLPHVQGLSNLSTLCWAIAAVLALIPDRNRAPGPTPDAGPRLPT